MAYSRGMFIAGRLCRRHLHKLGKILEMIGPEEGPTDTPKLREWADSEHGEALHIFDSESNSSEFSNLAEFCRKRGLSYACYVGGDADCGPTVDFWKPGLRQEMTYDTDNSDVTLSARQIRDRIARNKLVGEILAEIDEVDNHHLQPLTIYRETAHDKAKRAFRKQRRAAKAARRTV